MADKTAGQLEPVPHVSKANEKTLEPRTSWSNYILIYIVDAIVSRAFLL